MKVALVVPGGVDRSGTHRVVPCLLALIERLVAAGDEVHVFALLQEPEPGSWSLLGASVHNAGRRPRSLRTIRAMLAQHRRARFDVIHAVCYWNRTAAVGAAASLLLRVPLVVSLVDGEVVRHPAIAFGGQRTWRSRLALRLAARRARAVTAQSDYMRDLAARVGIAASTVILGVDLRQWPPLPPRPRRDGAALRLLHVGRFTEVKDQATLLEAMAMVRASGLRFELEVVGDGALSPQIRQTAQSLGLDGVVRFSPPMTQAELRSHVERADSTARILDVKYHVLLPSVKDVGGAVDYYQWSAVLRSVSAFEAYRKVYRDVITPLKLAELLILRDDIPRSLHFCIRQVFETLERVQNAQSAETLRQAGQILTGLQYGRISDIFASGLHEYLTDFLDSTQELSRLIQASFFSASTVPQQ